MDYLRMIDTALSMSMDTAVFLTHYVTSLVTSSDYYAEAIQSAIVKSVTVNKHTSSTAQHEYLTFEISDANSQDPVSYLLFLERTPSNIQSDPSYFTSHPDSRLFLDTILRQLVSPSSSTQTLNPNESHENIPLLDTSSSSSSTSSFSRAADTSSSPSTSFLSRAADTSTSSFSRLMGAASLASTQAIPWSRNIVLKSTTVKAMDQFLVGQHARSTHGSGQIVRQLQPHGLTLFHLIILANIVHNHDPLYSLLKRQCYWFANTIFYVILKNFICTNVVNGGDPFNEMIEDAHIPPNDYLPDLAGRWMGFRVMSLSKQLIELVSAMFESKRAEELAKVGFQNILVKFT